MSGETHQIVTIGDLARLHRELDPQRAKVMIADVVRAIEANTWVSGPLGVVSVLSAGWVDGGGCELALGAPVEPTPRMVGKLCRAGVEVVDEGSGRRAFTVTVEFEKPQPIAASTIWSQAKALVVIDADPETYRPISDVIADIRAIPNNGLMAPGAYDRFVEERQGEPSVIEPAPRLEWLAGSLFYGGRKIGQSVEFERMPKKPWRAQLVEDTVGYFASDIECRAALEAAAKAWLRLP